MVTVARRRRIYAADHRRLVSIAVCAIGFHVLLLSALRAPESRAYVLSRIAAYQDSTEKVSIAGGLFDVNLDCAADAAQVAFARMVVCQTPFVPETRACMKSAMSEYRIARVDCSAPDESMIGEYDAIEPHIDPIELAMLDVAEEIIEEAEEELAELNMEGQVVEMPPPAVEEAPDDADYLSEFNSNPDKQTKRSGALAGAIIPRDPRPPDRTKDPNAGAEPALPDVGQPGASALDMRAPGAPGEPAITQPPTGRSFGFERMTEAGIGALESVTRTDPAAPVGTGGSDGARVGKTATGTMPHNLELSKEAYDRSAGGTNDHLPEVEYGDFTSLRSRKWKYASFFNRVKRQVAQNWNPEEAYRMRDPNGNVYGTKDRLTVLQVSLTPEGALAKVLVSEPCGVDFLDDEAIKAFRAAEPFPNPPRGLVDAESRLITFRFGFSFEINSSTPWKVFRYR